MKYYSLFTYNSLWTTPARPLSQSLCSFSLCAAAVGEVEDEGSGCGGECEGKAAASRAYHPSSPVPGERRHRVDLAMAVEEARSGPGGIHAPLRGDGGRPHWREGAGGEVRSQTR